jgi:hypothetical protein
MTSQANADDPILTALSERHPSYTKAGLTSAAGGEDELIGRLLELRSYTALPQVSIRAEGLLLEFASRDDVARALEADITNPATAGLARTVAMGVDKVPSSAARARLADAVVRRGKGDSTFLPYARQLTGSSDPQVRTLAKSLN